MLRQPNIVVAERTDEQKIGRKLFDFLYSRLSYLADKKISRMDLWQKVGEICNPTVLTKEEALSYLRVFAPTYLPEIPARKLQRLIRDLERWNPTAETPEEIFERICGRPPDEM